MRSKVLALTCIVSVCLVAQIGASALQDSQSTSTTQTTTASVKKTSSGEKSVAGCVAREGEGFVLKTDDGTYDFNTARDLSPYVGKKVRISGRWNSTGVTTTAPIKTTATRQPLSNQLQIRLQIRRLRQPKALSAICICTLAER